MQEVNFDSKELIESEINNKKKFKKLRNWYSSLSQNQKYTLWFSSIIILIILIGIISFLVIILRPNSAINASNTSIKTTPLYTKVKLPPQKKYTDPLDGVQLNSQTNLNRPALAVMIENSITARPQSGLNSADLVYEAQVEGSITRFMAVFLANTPSMIGPIRSARLYYISWAQGLGALYTHWGGNIYALEKLKTDNIPNIDAIFTPGSDQTCSNSVSIVFCRLDTRYAPHNGYGNTQNIWNLGQQQGLFSNLTLGKNITPYQFSNTPKTKDLGKSGSSINIFFDQGVIPYDVSWIYNQSTNSYTRYNGGSKQYDALTNQPLTAKNVVVLYVNGHTTSYPGEGTTEAAAPIWILNTVGSGNAYIFENGQEIQATWNKSSDNSRMMFTTQSGSPVTFQRGEIWFEVIEPQTGSFTYTPAT